MKGAGRFVGGFRLGVARTGGGCATGTGFGFGGAEGLGPPRVAAAAEKGPRFAVGRSPVGVPTAVASSYLTQLRYYFDVNNAYVTQKLKVLTLTPNPHPNPSP